MHTLQAVITGSVQGLSEFLPISSSAHIVFANELYNLITLNSQNINHAEEIFFDIIVHLGTLLAVLIYFYRDLKEIIINFFNSFIKKDYSNPEFKIACYIILTTVITGVIGLILKNPVEFLVKNPQTICLFLMMTGIILLLSEKMYKANRTINLKSAIFIGIAQGLAIFPGFSRSGLTISAALMSGLERIEAARFSFLISIPVILLASMVYPILELDLSEISQFNLKAICIGFFVSFVVGYLCIKYFMKLLGRLSLRSFGYYCLVAAPLMWVLFQFFYRQ